MLLCVVASAVASACSESASQTSSPTTQQSTAIHWPLKHALLAAGAPCPVTTSTGVPRGAPRVLVKYEGEAGASTIYGNGPLWVILPAEQSSGPPGAATGYSVKAAWFVFNSVDDLHVVAHRLDGPGTFTAIYGASQQPLGHGYFEPGSTLLSALGCWEIAGSVGKHAVSFIYSVYAA